MAPSRKAKPSAKKPRAARSAATRALLAADDPWDQVFTCFKVHFKGEGSTIKPSGKFSKPVWADKSNTIASCVKQVSGYENVSHATLAGFIFRKYDKNLNDLVYDVYKKREA